MRVIGISHVGSEEDIIEPFVRHAARFCDELIILDHGSCDATVEILQQLKTEGFAIHLLHDATIGHIEIDHIDRLLKMAANDFKADWIVGLDADEFIGGAADRSFLPMPVEGETQSVKLRMRTYFPTQEDRLEILNPVERILHRVETEPDIYKVIVPGWLARRADVGYRDGKHGLLIGGQEAPWIENRGVWLDHFSLRTPGQYAVKLASRQIQKLRYVAPRGSDVGCYDLPYRVLREEGFAVFAEKFHDMPIAWHLQPRSSFVSDPMRYLSGPLRYSVMRGDEERLVHFLLEYAERLAREDRPTPEEAGPPTVGEDRLTLEVSCPPVLESKSVQTLPGRAGWQVLSTPLECHPETTDVHFRLLTKPGMIELRQMKLRSKTGNEEQILGADEIRSRLRVSSGGLVIWAYPKTVCRLLVSRDPLIFVISGWDFRQVGSEVELAVDILYDPRPQLPLLLAPEVLDTLNFERNKLYADVDDAMTKLAASRRENAALRSKIAYEPGRAIDFREHGNAVLYQGSGWSWPEAWGTWTNGRRAVLNLRFSQPPKRALRLHIFAQAFLPPVQPEMRVDVSVNGRRLDSWVVKSAGLAERVITLTAPILSGETCEIIFDIPTAVSPAKLGLSGDQRELGLGLARLVIRA